MHIETGKVMNFSNRNTNVLKAKRKRKHINKGHIINKIKGSIRKTMSDGDILDLGFREI